MGKSCLKKIFKRVFVLILCILVSGVSIVSVSGKAYAASTNFLSDETINKFIELFYDAGSEAAEGVYDILSGEKEGTYEEFKNIYKNISAFYGVIDKSEVFAETAAKDTVANISRLNDIIGGCILIYDNAASFANSTNAVQKTVDGFQILKGAMSILGCGSYFPSGISLALNVTEITINLAGYLETQYFKENVAFYEIDLQMAYFTGSELPYPEAPNVIGFKLTQEEADSIYAQTYMKYYLKQMMDRIGKPVSDGSGNTGNSITGGIVFEKSSYSIAMNETCKFTSSFYSSAEQTDIVITYSSSDTSVFTTTSDGLVTPVNEGTAQLIATASNGVTARCEIVVYTPKIYIEEILLPQETLELAMNMQLTLTAGYYPSDANTDIGITYSSSNKSVIEVDSTGTVTPVGSGTANIIAISDNGVKGICEITVYPYNVSENDTGYTIDKYLGSETEISIIDSINDIDVTIIGNAAFQGCTSLTSITIPDSITSIGQCAFYNCSSLTSVIIGDSVASMGYGAFYNCTSLTGVYISDITSWCNINFSSLSFSGSNPLYYADNLYLNGELVTDLVIPNSATSIGNGAFYYYSKLTSVTTGDGVTSIGGSAFYNCSSLTSVTIGDSVRRIGKEAFYSCDNLTSVTIGDSVTSIGSSTFAYCTSLTSITIPDSVTSINDSAFYNCSSLTSVTIPDGVTSIGDSAFYWCSNLTYINIPNSVTSIKASAFRNCGRLTSVIIPNGVTRVSDSVFYNCTSLTSVTIPDGVTSIGDSAFEGCRSLTTVTIPDSVTSIGDSAFYGCWLINTITIPNSVTSIGACAFVDCRGLTSVTISDSVMSIDEFTFSSCASLASITIPDGVTSIKSNAFANCSALEKIEIPNSVETIDTTAFINDTKTVIYCQKNSSAHTFAIDNNIPFIVDDDNTSVDFNKNLIYTNCFNTDISDIMSLSQGLTYVINSDISGTGAKVDVMKDDVLHAQYTLIVLGDTNGDSVCNVLDAFDAERASSGNNELSGAYAIAADINSDDAIDINDYQAIVNKALAS